VTARGRALLGAWAPPLLWAAGIFLLSSLPVRTGRTRIPFGDKAFHAAEYAVLGFLCARAWAAGRPAGARRAAAIAGAALAALYGAGDEFHQSFVPEREAEWGDLLADAAGAALGAAAFALASRRISGAASPGSGGPAPRKPGPPDR
jgi:VanZ family protein